MKKLGVVALESGSCEAASTAENGTLIVNISDFARATSVKSLSP
jgi:hypothetical protein